MFRRKILVLLGFLTAAISAPAAAQADAQGHWLGTLEINSQLSLRVVVNIGKDADGALTGSADSPDQNSFGIPLEELTLEGDTLSFAVRSIGASYKGDWNQAENRWDGTFTQNGMGLALVLSEIDAEALPQPILLPADWAVPDNTAIGSLLETRLAGRDGAGIVLGVLEGGEARYIARGSGGVFNENTLFEIGSMTKVFTALIMADMALKGEIALDDPVVKYLPEGAVMPIRGGQQISLRNLSLQDSGLPRLPDNMPFSDAEDPYADYTEALLLEFLSGYELTRDIGSQYEYSNLGVGLLGYALARAAGSDYESLVRERILDPLGMKDTAITLTPEQETRFATPHDQYMRPTKPWAIPVVEGAGALRSTASDMLKFLAAALDPQSPLAPAMELTLSDRLGEDGGPQTALGWMITAPPSGEMLHHGGGTGGFRTHMALQADKNRALAIFTNATPEPSTQDLAMHLLTGSVAANALPIPPAPQPMAQQVEVMLEGAQLDHVVGSYNLTPAVTLAVTREGEQLMAQLTGQPAFPIYASSPLGFFWRVVEARIEFHEEEGIVTGATLFQNGVELPMTRSQ